MMKKNLTEIVFILDRSGSMAGLEEDTIGGFNAMIEKQKGEAGEASCPRCSLTISARWSTTGWTCRRSGP